MKNRTENIFEIKDRQYDFGEKCGIVGVYTKDTNAPQITRRASIALQHRGQESSGLTVWKGDSLKTHMGMGLIPHVLTDEALERLGPSQMALAHNRYSTTGASSLTNCQPVVLTLGKYQVSIAHNGNIPPDITDLTKRLTMQLSATTDTALVAAVLLQERSNYASWEETIRAVMETIPAAYSFVILTEDGNLFGVRDIYGIRPFVLGKLFSNSSVPEPSPQSSPSGRGRSEEVKKIHRGWIMAGESVALDAVGASFMREIERGEIVRIDSEGKLHFSYFGAIKKQQVDIFEKIYFSRPDSFADGMRIRHGREESGRRLGRRMKKKGLAFDVVIPIFDSGYPAAKGAAQELNVPLVEAITTSHYVGRTFIQPGQARREAAVGSKHNLTPDGLFGKRALFVDDSAVRLTTSKSLVVGLRNAGVASVSAGFASPPVVNHDDMGIDMKSKSELPASAWENEGIDGIETHAADLIGADSVTYLPIEEVSSANGLTTKDIYYFPFGGPHPVRGPQMEFRKMKRTVNSKPRLAVFISGNGGNLQALIDQIEEGELSAEIVSVISNKADAYGLARAKKHEISSVVFESHGKLKDQAARTALEEEILAHIQEAKPDLIILAGWMLLLTDEFLTELQKKEIPVINLHPALLSDKGKDSVATSRGEIPVIKGMLHDVIKEAFNKKLLVTGITVHQVIPGSSYDAGPIILTEEVRIKEEESQEELEARIHEAEHRILPAAIKRVLHVMQKGVDISHGAFSW